MESALADIEFLVRSPNRVEILGLLADSPQSRSDLAAATGASQATLGRILTDFEERSWVRRTDGEYAATATGELVARGFGDLLDVLETEQALRDIVDYLPTEAMDFDLARLADATITVPTEMRPNAPLQRLLDLARGADEVRAFSHAFNEQTLTLTAERVTDGDLSFQGVFSRGAIESLAADPTLRRRLESLLGADDVTVRVRDEEIPIAVTIADDVVHLLVRDDDGVLRASVDTDDPAVSEWAETAFRRYWETGTRLDRTELPSDD